MSDYIQIEKRGFVYILTLHRPDKLNALSYKNVEEIEATLDVLNKDKNCKVLIITGAGRAFCAGADVSPENMSYLGEGLTDVTRAMASTQRFKQCDRKIEYARPFTIAAINGYALGGGLEMACACDIRVAADTAKMGIPETKLGSFPGGGGTQYLPRMVGLGHAKELLATAEKITAARALEIGLVEHVVPAEELIEYCVALGERISKNSTTAIAAGKHIMGKGYGMDMERALEIDNAWVGVLGGSYDRLEGRKAFAEKREPVFE